MSSTSESGGHLNRSATLTTEFKKYYDILAEEMSPEVATVIVTEGTRSDEIKEIVRNFFKNDHRMSDEDSQHIAELFSDKLKDEKVIEEYYIPSLRAICKWKNNIWGVATHMMGALLRRVSFSVDEEVDGSEDGIKWDVCSWLTPEFPWNEVFSALNFRSLGYATNYGDKALTKLVSAWERTIPSVEERKSILHNIDKELSEKKFADVLGVIIDNATLPLEHLEEGMKESIVGICLTPQLAVDLFLLDKDVNISVSLKIFARDEDVSDEKIAAIVKEAVAMEKITKEMVQTIPHYFLKRSLVQSIAELLRSGHTPSTHPFIHALSSGIEEPVCYRILTLCNPDLNSLNCMFGENTALHLAARCGYSKVAKEILLRGYHQLLNKGSIHAVKECEDPTNAIRPVTAAVKTAQFSTATLLLKAMEPKDGVKSTETRWDAVNYNSNVVKFEFLDAMAIFTTKSNRPEPEINLHNVMEEILSKQGEKWKPKDKRFYSPWKIGNLTLDDERDVEERVKFIETALDKTIDGEKIDLSVLIEDENRDVPEVFKVTGDTPTRNLKESADLEKSGRKKVGETLYHKIAQSNLEDLKDHECFTTLINDIWSDYVYIQGALFSFYIIFIGFLTTSLVLGARSNDPSKYSDPIDWFRLFCEIITILFVFKDLILELHEVHEIYTGVVCRQSPMKCINMVIKPVVIKYLLNWQNILDDLSILFVFLIIPFRIADSDIQWIFAAPAFLFNGLRVFKYAIMFEGVGEYVAILILIIKRDVPHFVMVFIVIIFSMGGALYLSLIGYYNDEHTDAANYNETSEIYLLWGTGFRILAEGSVLTYTGPGGFNWLGVLIYWLFLFIVVVVMLNILIAQFSKSYEEETQKSKINVVLTRAYFIVKRDPQLVRWIRNTFFKRNVDYSSFTRRKIFVGKGEGDKPASSGQLEGLQTQTKKLGLQLLKHMDDNRGMEKIKTMIGSLSEKFKTTDKLTGKLTEMDGRLTEMDGRLIGLERVVVDTRRYVDEIHQMLSSMQDNR